MATLSFKGKSFIQNYHLAVKYHELIPVKKKSLTSKVSLKDNLIIHGDNLKALKALLPTYAGKVKCIYIDPPYNTGRQTWKYNDNVNSPMMQEWLGKVVDKEDLTRHDKWLCMMTPRLKLLRDLLAENGVIFVSIDDSELHNLRKLLDEIFNEPNFVASFVWNTEGHTDNQYHIKINHEYILTYCRNSAYVDEAIGYVIDPNTRKESNLWKGYAENSITKNGPGNPPREVILKVGFPCKERELELDKSPITMAFYDEVKEKGYITRTLTSKYKVEYPIRKDKMVISGGTLKEDCRVYSGWANINKLQKFINNGYRPIEEEDGIFRFYLSKNGVIYYRKDREKARNILSVLRNLGTTETNKYNLEKIGIDFEYPKPLELIQYLIQIGSHSENDIVLDSFSGSGTTAHAVLKLNSNSSIRRKFILVECEDYADRVTAERIRKVIKGEPTLPGAEWAESLGGSFSFFELGEPIEMESILEGSRFPSYLDLARYVFYTATGEEFLPEQIDEDKHFIGESKEYEVYLFYKPDLDYLKSTALTLEVAKGLGDYTGKKKLVFAPTKYLDLNDSELLAKHSLKDIDYCQLPFEIYKLKE